MKLFGRGLRSCVSIVIVSAGVSRKVNKKTSVSI